MEKIFLLRKIFLFSLFFGREKIFSVKIFFLVREFFFLEKNFFFRKNRKKTRKNGLCPARKTGKKPWFSAGWCRFFPKRWDLQHLFGGGGYPHFSAFTKDRDPQKPGFWGVQKSRFFRLFLFFFRKKKYFFFEKFFLEKFFSSKKKILSRKIFFFLLEEKKTSSTDVEVSAFRFVLENRVGEKTPTRLPDVPEVG